MMIGVISAFMCNKIQRYKSLLYRRAKKPDINLIRRVYAGIIKRGYGT